MKNLYISGETVTQIEIIDDKSCYVKLNNSQNAYYCLNHLKNLEVCSRVEGGSSLGYVVPRANPQQDDKIYIEGNLKNAILITH